MRETTVCSLYDARFFAVRKGVQVSVVRAVIMCAEGPTLCHGARTYFVGSFDLNHRTSLSTVRGRLLMRCATMMRKLPTSHTNRSCPFKA